MTFHFRDVELRKVALALRGIEYDDVKGDNLGFCFRGRPCDYPFEVGGAK